MADATTTRAERLEQFAGAVACCFNPGHTAEIPSNIGVALRQFVPFDYATCLIIKPDAAPVVVLEELPEDVEPVRFERAPYFLDPIFQRLLDGTLPVCCALRDIMPDAFEESDYYRYYYGHSDDFDEVSYNIPLEDDAVFHLAMTRVGCDNRFGDDEQALLAALEPLVRSVVLRYVRKNRVIAGPAAASAHRYHRHVSDVLDRFGTSVLTERERQVVRMAMRGFSDVLAATELKIRPSTYRNHKKSIYRKLGVTSQGQVFGLFLRALRLHPRDIRDGDPLLVVLRPREDEAAVAPVTELG